MTCPDRKEDRGQGHPEPPPRGALVEMFEAAGIERVQIAPREGFAAFSGRRS